MEHLSGTSMEHLTLPRHIFIVSSCVLRSEVPSPGHEALTRYDL